MKKLNTLKSLLCINIFLILTIILLLFSCKDVDIPQDKITNIETDRGTITLNGTSGEAQISFTINLDTGNISGTFFHKEIKEMTFLDRCPSGEFLKDVIAGCTTNYSINCKIEHIATIKGKIDLETKYITANGLGTSKYSGTGKYSDSIGGYCSEIDNQPFSFTLTGYLSEDNSSASVNTLGDITNNWKVHS